MAIVHSAGVPIHYELIGDGPPIVLVHGFASSFEGNWGQSGWIDFLVAHGRQVVGVDCRGHGESGKPRDAAAYEVRHMADDVIAAMDAAGVRRADLMGYSMGGRLVINLLARFPDRFSSAVVGGAGVPPPTDLARRAAITAALETDDVSTITDPLALFFRQFAESRTHDPHSLAGQNNDLKALSICFAGFSASRPLDEFEEAALKRLDVPVLAVVGEKDDAVGPAQRLVETVLRSRLVVLPGEDHLSAVPTQKYKEAVAAFLKEHSLSLA
ncbi:MAG: alpha/beta hydrolase [Chloroflexota bacterium]|nr:alpha/beta hydrolase [Chloroflexota bacterium]